MRIKPGGFSFPEAKRGGGGSEPEFWTEKKVELARSGAKCEGHNFLFSTRTHEDLTQKKVGGETAFSV